MKIGKAMLFIAIFFIIVIILITSLLGEVYANAYQLKPTPAKPQPILASCSAFKNIGQQKGLNITDPPKMVKINKQIIAFVTEDRQLNDHLMLYNLGPDLQLGTNDDGQPQQAMPNDDGLITTVNVFNNTAVWLQSVPLVYEEIYLCSYPRCGSAPPQLVTTNDSRFGLQGAVSLYGNKLAWSLLNIPNTILGNSFAYCDIDKTGQPGGCDINDLKNIVTLTLGIKEHLSNLKTTENNLYIRTSESLGPQMFRDRMYIYNYKTLALTPYYDEISTNIPLRDFDPVTFDNNDMDVLYLLYNAKVDFDFIANGQGNFLNRRTFSRPGVLVTHMSIDRNAKNAFDFSYIGNNTLNGKTELSISSPKAQFTIPLTDYERKILDYSMYDSLNFVGLGPNAGDLLYTRCSY